MDKEWLRLHAFLEGQGFPSKGIASMHELYLNYQEVCAHSLSDAEGSHLFEAFLHLMLEQMRQPYPFEIFHKQIRNPFDYYQFGLDFIRPLIDIKHSKLQGIGFLKQIESHINNKENVILLANHQTEPDPQIISLLIEKFTPQLASEMIFVAGHRVITDPMAIPLSMGRNLVCIYSKKHMAYPPEAKAKKVLHNQRTLKKVGELLNQGGCCIYVAPSGGRDRLNAENVVEVAPFDAASLELFWLLAQQAEPATHFYPLALKTYDLMPPPRQVEKELGEKRYVRFSPVYLAFGPEIDMQHLPSTGVLDKKAKRTKRAERVWQMVKEMYDSFLKN